jgi:hypothetical protein
MLRILALLLLILSTSVGFTAPAWAHAVDIDYQVAEHTKLQTQSLFSTGEPLQLAPVKVFAPNMEQPWLEAQTDVQGQFAFVPDRKINGDWQVAIGEGNHANALTLDVSSAEVKVKEIAEKQAHTHTPNPIANPLGQQFMVVGFAAVAGGLGKALTSLRQKG